MYICLQWINSLIFPVGLLWFMVNKHINMYIYISMHMYDILHNGLKKSLWNVICTNDNRVTWLNYVIIFLYKYGFGFVWESQGVEFVEGF